MRTLTAHVCGQALLKYKFFPKSVIHGKQGSTALNKSTSDGGRGDWLSSDGVPNGKLLSRQFINCINAGQGIF